MPRGGEGAELDGTSDHEARVVDVDEMARVALGVVYGECRVDPTIDDRRDDAGSLGFVGLGAEFADLPHGQPIAKKVGDLRRQRLGRELADLDVPGVAPGPGLHGQKAQRDDGDDGLA